MDHYEAKVQNHRDCHFPFNNVDIEENRQRNVNEEKTRAVKNRGVCHDEHQNSVYPT